MYRYPPRHSPGLVACSGKYPVNNFLATQPAAELSGFSILATGNDRGQRGGHRSHVKTSSPPPSHVHPSTNYYYWVGLSLLSALFTYIRVTSYILIRCTSTHGRMHPPPIPPTRESALSPRIQDSGVRLERTRGMPLAVVASLAPLVNTQKLCSTHKLSSSLARAGPRFGAPWFCEAYRPAATIYHHRSMYITVLSLYSPYPMYKQAAKSAQVM